MGFSSKDIKILTLETEKESIINNIDYIGNYRIVHEIDNENILYTTSRKFKGMEGNVVILIEVKKKTFLSEEQKRNFYVAASRAKQKLDIILSVDENELRDIADEIKEIQVSNNLAKVAMKLKVRLMKD